MEEPAFQGFFFWGGYIGLRTFWQWIWWTTQIENVLVVSWPTLCNALRHVCLHMSKYTMWLSFTFHKSPCIFLCSYLLVNFNFTIHQHSVHHIPLFEKSSFMALQNTSSGSWCWQVGRLGRIVARNKQEEQDRMGKGCEACWRQERWHST